MSFSGSVNTEYLFSRMSDAQKLADKLDELGSILRLKLSDDVKQFLLYNPLNIKYQRLCESLEFISKMCGGVNEFPSLPQYFAAREFIELIDPSMSVFDEKTIFPSEYESIAQVGAEGLYSYGILQFSALKEFCLAISNSIISKRVKSVCLIDSPLGNILPNRVLYSFLSAKGIKVAIKSISIPRNEKACKGHTVKSVIVENIQSLDTAVEMVLYLDDVITGTRYNKVSSILDRQLKITNILFLPCAMVFHPHITRQYKPKKDYKINRKRVFDKAKDSTQEFGFQTYKEFPSLPLMKIDDGDPFVYDSPVVWGEQALVSGMRKVNLIFNLIENQKGLMEDIESNCCGSRTALESLWSKDSQGRKCLFANGLLSSCFSKYNSVIDWDVIHSTAKIQYSDDYDGHIIHLQEGEIMGRIKWVKDEVSKAIASKLGMPTANLVNRALSDLFSIQRKFFDQGRDIDYCNYVLPYNKTIKKLHETLVTLTVNT